MRSYSQLSCVATTMVLICLVTPQTSASTIILATHSSGPNQIAPGFLDATLDFQVAGTVLTLTATNDTVAPDMLDISELYINTLDADGVTNLSLVSVTHSAEGDVAVHWPLFASDWTGPGDHLSTTQANGFGVYDYALLVNRDVSPKRVLIGPGENIVFVIDISGTGPFDMDTFTTELSIDPVDDEPAILGLAAAKFRGVDGGSFQNLSAFATTAGVVGSAAAACPYTCGDLDGDAAVNLVDFSVFLNCYGIDPDSSVEFGCADMNGDDVVNLSDFELFARHFGGYTTTAAPNCE